MVDEKISGVREDSIRRLIFELGKLMDQRFADVRKGTDYEKVRPSDVRLFVMATRKRFTISELAREMAITRQAAHASVNRLIKLRIVALEDSADDHREKFVAITPRGIHARDVAVFQTAKLEQEFAEFSSQQALDHLRESLSLFVTMLANAKF